MVALFYWDGSFQVALQDLQTNSKIAALLPYFVYVVSGVSDQFSNEDGPAVLRVHSRCCQNGRLLLSLHVFLSHLLLPTGQICKPRPGAAAPTTAGGTELDKEPTPLLGALCPIPGGECALLRLGATGRLHQPFEWPLDSSGWGCASTQPHLLVATGLEVNRGWDGLQSQLGCGRKL